MNTKRSILLKLTGTILQSSDQTGLERTALDAVAQQLKSLHSTHQFGIVTGGGNIFRGNQQGTLLKLTQAIGHQLGMLATLMNALIIKDIFEQHEISTRILSTIAHPEAELISVQAINEAKKTGTLLIFAGGSGNPYFTTDTSAIIRGLQMEADEIWKGTNVDGVYSADPRHDPAARRMEKVTFDDALKNSLGILDATAYALAKTHGCKLRVFNIFAPQALLEVAHNRSYGTTLER